MKIRIINIVVLLLSVNCVSAQLNEESEISISRIEQVQANEIVLESWFAASAIHMNAKKEIERLESSIENKLDSTFSKEEMIELKPNVFCLVNSEYAIRKSTSTVGFDVEFYDVKYFREGVLLAKKTEVFIQSGLVYESKIVREVDERQYYRAVENLECSFSISQSVNKLSIRCDSHVNEVKIYNTLFQQVNETKSNNLVYDFNVKRYPSGVYFVFFTDKNTNRTCTQKVILP
jgi:hypothetical protein